MKELMILHSTLLKHIEEQHELGNFDLLKKMFFIQKINKCFEEMDEEFTYYDLFDLFSKHEDLHNLLTITKEQWRKQFRN